MFKYRKGFTKKRKRVIFYAIITYKDSKSVEKCMNTQSIQGRINHLKEMEAEPELDPLDDYGFKGK